MTPPGSVAPPKEERRFYRAMIAEIKKRDEAVMKVAEEAKGQLDAAGEQLIEAQSLTQERLVILGIEAALAHIREAARLREALDE